MITIEQCRAARGLLDWTQQDLAEASGLSKTAINNFEKGHSDIKVESLRAIRMAFESADIEFLDHEGLRKKADKAHIVSGPVAFAEILESIRHSMTSGVREVLIQSFDSRILKQIGQDDIDHYLSVVESTRTSQRILCGRGQVPAIASPSSVRWVGDEQLQSGMMSFIFGEKLVLRAWQQNLFIIVQSRTAATAEKIRFEAIWETAHVPAQQQGKQSEAS